MSPNRVAPSRAAIAASISIDAIVVAAVVAASGFLVPLGMPFVLFPSTATALLTLALLFLWRGIRGTSVGHAVLAFRTIDAISGLPSFRFRARRVTVSRGDVDDPFALRAHPVPFAPLAPDSPRPAPTRSHLRIVVDDGTVHAVHSAAVVGRDPTVPLDPRHALVAIPDLSRTIAKAHVLIEVSEDGLLVTDLGSAAGTRIGRSGAPLAPHVVTSAPWGAELFLGERRITLERRRRTAEVP